MVNDEDEHSQAKAAKKPPRQSKVSISLTIIMLVDVMFNKGKGKVKVIEDHDDRSYSTHQNREHLEKGSNPTERITRQVRIFSYCL